MDRMWLLVEWVDEKSNMFPSYGIVNVNSLVHDTGDLHTGKMIFIQTRYGHSARRAQILRISEDKRQIKEYKLFMQRQDQQVKNVISMCMRTIKDIKSDPAVQDYSVAGCKKQALAGPSGSRSSGLPRVIAETDSDSSDVDSDSESSQVSEDIAPARISKSAKVITPKKRIDPSLLRNQSMRQKRPPALIASTPVSNKGPAKVTVDKEIQTDPTEHPILPQLDEMESTLRNLYDQYLVLEGSIQNNQNRVRELLQADVSETEHRSAGSDREQAEGSLTGHNSEESGERQTNNSDAEIKVNGHSSNARTLHVRRVSAQTTNNAETIYNDTPNNNRGNDMISIGNGNVTVPARLMREINWDNYSTATRQLLQAVFPRRILATHSLSGKQSPAFADRPPKKQLDPRMIEDIVNTVSLRCGVPRRLVRSSITTKCTDEAKLYRNRQCGRRRRSRQVNSTNVHPENISAPLSPLSSHESSNGLD